MPAAYEVKSSWADEVEEESGSLPAPTEVYENGFKVLTEYKYNDDNKKVKVVRTYKIEKRIVSKTIAVRKNWPKFGDSSDDRPGPDPATTIGAEDVFMQFISSKEEENKVEDESLDKLKSMGDKGIVKCRNCNGDHWTSKCPYKDTVLAGGKVPDDKKPPTRPGAPEPAPQPGGENQKGKYVPPSMRDGGNRRGDSMQMQRRDDTTAIRISNLSESTNETDLEELVKPFGYVLKQYLAKDRNTNLCKGFAYVHFKYREEAAKAINHLNGYGYDHLILSVDWSKPPAQQN